MALRSWEQLPFGYYMDGIQAVFSLTQNEYFLAYLCDGEHDLENSPLLESLLKRKLIQPCDKGDTLTDWQKPRTYPNRCFPRLNWAITGKCNFNCLHCFMAADNAPMMEEYDWEECLAILDDCERCGIQTLTLTGGEPMLHPRFMDILRECKRRHLTIMDVNTNGSFITADFLDEVRALGHDIRFKISFDGIGHHDWLRNVPGIEAQTAEAIRLCKEKGFTVQVQTNVHKNNLHVIEDTMIWLDELGVDSVRVARTMETPRWQENGDGLCLGMKEYYDEMMKLTQRLLPRIKQMQIALWHVVSFIPTQKIYSFAPTQNVAKSDVMSQPVCRGARKVIALANTGELLPCNQLAGTFAKLEMSCGNIKKKPLHDLIREGPYLDCVTLPTSDIAEHNSNCKECTYWRVCQGGCRAIATGYFHDYLRYDISKCLFLKGGYIGKFDRIFEAAATPYRNINDLEGIDRDGDPAFIRALREGKFEFQPQKMSTGSNPEAKR